MRRLGDGLLLEAVDLERVARSATAGALASRQLGDHPAADDLARLALAAEAVADCGQLVSDPCADPPEPVTLTEWVELHDVHPRTARRWFKAGKVPGAMRTAAGWVVTSS